MLKKILTVSAAMLLTLASYVAAVEVRDDHPDTYVVQKGDTLWDIAARFLNEPWLWPEIWQANPQVENPHLIYPGDVLSLAYLGGRATLIKKSPTARRVGGEAIDALPLGEIEPFLKKAHVLDEDTYRSLPYVVSLEENRLRSTEGQIAYVRGGSFDPGQTWAVLRPTVRYSARPNKDGSDRGLRSVPWDAQHGANPLVSPEWAYIQEMSDRHEVLGYEAIEITQGVVTRGGDPATLLITPGGHEVKQGDLLIPYDPQPYDLSFYPRAMDNVPPDVRILAQTDRLHFGGPRDVIAISAGAREGVENGHVFAIYHPGDLVRDEIAHPRRISANRDKNKVQMPDEFVGHVMVFRTFDKISYGLIMDGIRPAKIGDRLVAPERRR